MTFPVRWTQPLPNRAHQARREFVWSRLVEARGCFATPLTTIARGQTSITRLLNVARTSLASGPRVQRPALAVAISSIKHSSVQTDEATISAVVANPVGVARASTGRMIQNTVRTLASTNIAAFTSPALLALALALTTVGTQECSMSTNSMTKCPVDRECANAALWSGPRKLTAQTRARVKIQNAAMLAVLGARQGAVMPIVGPNTIFTNAVVSVEQPPSGAVVKATITLGTTKVCVTDALTLVLVESAVVAVELALIALVATPVPVALTRAIIHHFAVDALLRVTRALARLVVQFSTVGAPQCAIRASLARPITLAIFTPTTHLSAAAVTSV